MNRLTRYALVLTTLLTLGAVAINQAYRDDEFRDDIKNSRIYPLVEPLAPIFMHGMSKAEEVFLNSDAEEYKILVDKSDRNMYLFDENTDLDTIPQNVSPDSYESMLPVALGRPDASGNSYTPTGEFSVIGKRSRSEEISRDGDWLPGWGDYMLILDVDFPHVNIHGTNNLSRIGRYVSDACIETTADSMLYEDVAIGSKGLVRE